MSKWSKLRNDPLKFVKDMRAVRYVTKKYLPFEEQFDLIGENLESNIDAPIVFLFGFSVWKRKCVANYFPEYRVAFIRGRTSIATVKKYLDKYKNKQIVVWGYNEPKELKLYCTKNSLSIWRMEDGFIRSSGLGAAHNLPFSLVIDKTGMHFNPSEPSDLEKILSNYNFQKDRDLLKRASLAIDKIKEDKISKYNFYKEFDAETIYGAKGDKQRILVLGQVEDDASVLYSYPNKITNNDVIKLAQNENPDAEIFYKPHPDVVEKCRKRKSVPEKIIDNAKIIYHPINIQDSLKTIDKVYTISSLAGFEALLHGVEVTCVGMPFYAGWGLTDDRQECSRRNRKLSVAEIFAAAYILYPQYRDALSGDSLEIEEVIEIIEYERQWLTKQSIDILKEVYPSDDAIIEAMNALKDNPDDTEILKTIIPILETAIEYYPDREDLSLALIKIKLQQNKWLEAITLLPKIYTYLDNEEVLENIVDELSSIVADADSHLFSSILLSVMNIKHDSNTLLLIAGFFKKNSKLNIALGIYEKLHAAYPNNKLILNSLADVNLAVGEYDDSLHFALLLQEINPNELISNKIANLRMLKKEVSEASSAYRNIIKSSPKNIKAKINLAKTEISNGNYSEAKSLLNECIEQDYKNLGSYIELAEIYRIEGDLRKSIDVLEISLQLNGDNAPKKIYLLLSKRYEDIDNLEKSYEVLKLSLVNYPNDPHILFSLGVICSKLLLLNEAENYLRSSINFTSPTEKMSTIYVREKALGRALLNQGRYDEAPIRLEKYRAKHSPSAAVLGELQNIYIATNDLEKFVEVSKEVVYLYEIMLEATPFPKPDIYLKLSKAHEKAGNNIKSREFFDLYCDKSNEVYKDKKSFSELFIVEIEKGNWFRLRNDSDAANVCYAKAEEYAGENIELIKRLFAERKNIMDIDNARRHLRVISSHYNDVKHKEMLAEFLYNFNLFSNTMLNKPVFNEIRALIAEILECEPDKSSTWLLKGKLELAVDNYENAISYLETAVKLAPERRKGLLALAEAYEGLYEIEKAEEYYSAALDGCEFVWDNDIARATYHLATIRQFLGKYEEAARLNNKLVHFYKKAIPEITKHWSEKVDKDSTGLLIMIGGPGDQLRELSFLPMLKRKVRELNVSCDWRIYELVKRTYPEINIIPVIQNTHVRKSNSDLWVESRDGIPRSAGPAMINKEVYAKLFQVDYVATSRDLSQAFFAGEELPENCLSAGGYLKLHNDTIIEAKQILDDYIQNKNVLRVGVTWRTIREYVYPSKANMPLDMLSDVFKIDNVEFVNLQNNISDSEIEIIRSRFGAKFHIIDEVDVHDNQELLGGILKELDVVLTAGTSIRDLAGAVGAETWSFTVFPGYLDLWRKQENGLDVWQPSIKHYDLYSYGSKKLVTQKIAEDLSIKAINKMDCYSNKYKGSSSVVGINNIDQMQKKLSNA